ncbi:hypothetical protein PORY_002390 [Pneumocystis oryctolagi]|uniref:Uncharacterized protein n=1 Tax=Pneumocystis oryctolagi TaxID=42067 RepID=A0ACB7C938_9ASCO|nr:hypothetical protein PORY_002390 [Pneumocystis oryctolagi]
MLKLCNYSTLNTISKIYRTISNKSTLYQNYLMSSNSITKTYTITYSGYLTSSVKSIKLFSIGSLYLTYLVSPIILFANANIDFLVKFIMTTIAIGTTSLSTALIHFVLSPYVTKLHYSNNKFQIETLSLLGKKIIWTGDSKKLKENKTGRLFANIESVEDKKRWFYIHEDQQGLEILKLINSNSKQT